MCMRSVPLILGTTSWQWMYKGEMPSKLLLLIVGALIIDRKACASESATCDVREAFSIGWRGIEAHPISLAAELSENPTLADLPAWCMTRS